MPKSKTVEFSLPFSGDGTKMANWNLGKKRPKLAKITIFRNLRQAEVSASDMWLGIHSREISIFSKSFENFE